MVERSPEEGDVTSSTLVLSTNKISMTFAENLFILVSIIVFITLVISIKKINWDKLGFAPKSLFNGWWQIILFNASIFALVQLTIVNKFLDLPSWMVDKDPLFGLLIITFSQEVIFRSIIINSLERFGKQKALWGSILIFVLFHLIAPYAWSSTGIIFAGLTFVGGYFWGWHFLKFRNIYLLGISHFLVNLSFNFFIVQFLIK